MLAGGAHYDYGAVPAEVRARVERLRAACAGHGVALKEAAFRFPLLHPAVVCVALGSQTVAEMEDNLRVAHVRVPEGLWAELAAEGLIPEDLGGRPGG